MVNVFVVEFGPNNKIKNATKAAKFLRDYFDIPNRLCSGDANYAKDGGFAYLRENPSSWEKICVVRDLASCWITNNKDFTLVFLTGDRDYIGII